jgi:hypothetical protein
VKNVPLSINGVLKLIFHFSLFTFHFSLKI